MQNRRWVGDDLWNLLYLPPADLRIIYPDHTWESLRNKRKLYRRKVKKGEIMPPRRSEEYPGANEEHERAQQRRRRAATPAGRAALSELISLEDRKRLHDQLDKLIDEANLPPETISQIRIKKISKWEQGIKNSDGEFEAHPLFGIQLEADPKKFEPEWPVIQPALEQIRLPKVEVNNAPSNSEHWLILPDNQIHYWQTEAGEYLPFHDVHVHALALQIIQDLKRDVHGIINLGDFLDAPTFSTKHIQNKAFAGTTNRAIQFGHNYLAFMRNLVPKKPIHLLKGNHTARLDTYGKTNAQAAFGVKQANERWPALSEPFLLHLDKLKVEYLDGYSDAGHGLWLTDDLIVTHAPIRRQHFQEKVSNVHGHLHRASYDPQTVNTRYGAIQRFTASPGTMSRIDGFVPSANGVVANDGIPIPRAENWHHGFGLISIDRMTGALGYTPMLIDTYHNYQLRFNGKTYTPDQELVAEMETWGKR